MRVFVTGANGQVGRELTRVLAGSPLYLATHESDDVANPHIVDTIVRERPDLVVHAAAMTDVDACERDPARAYLVNEVGAAHVAKGAVKAGAFLIALSTDYVFDGEKGSPYVESDLPHPLSLYGASKLAGERAVAQAAPRACIVRTAWVFGEGKRHFITMVLDRIRQGEPVSAVVDKYGSPTSAKDLVSVLLQLAKVQPTGVLHVAGQGLCNWYEYAQAIGEYAGSSYRVDPIDFAALQRPAPRPANSALASERLASLGITVRPWRDMVRDYVKTASGADRRFLPT